MHRGLGFLTIHHTSSDIDFETLLSATDPKCLKPHMNLRARKLSEIVERKVQIDISLTN